MSACHALCHLLTSRDDSISGERLVCEGRLAEDRKGDTERRNADEKTLLLYLLQLLLVALRKLEQRQLSMGGNQPNVCGPTEAGPVGAQRRSAPLLCPSIKSVLSHFH